MWNKLSFDVMFVGDDWYQSDRWVQLQEKFTAVGARGLLPVHAWNLVHHHQPDLERSEVGWDRELKAVLS